MLAVALKDRECSHNNMSENLHFEQSRLSYINHQEKTTPKIYNWLYGVDGVPKTDHEIYVSSAKKAYSIFSFAFFIVSVRLYYDRVKISAVLN